MRKLNSEQITDVLCGATLLGGGGGGSLSNGIDMLRTFEKFHGPAEVDLITVDEMEDTGYAAITAGMGAPSAIKDVDFSSYAVNAYEYLVEMAKKMDQPKDICYCTAIECGGFNTFVPMMISMLKKKPYIDADGCGRAVPALETLLLNVNGCNTSPLAMANANNDRVYIETSDPKNAKLCEDLGRGICVTFNMLSGLSGWMLSKEDIATKIVNNSVSLAQDIGYLLRTEGSGQESIFEKLPTGGHHVCIGEIKEINTEQKHGFDVGETIIVGQDHTEWVVKFINENIVLYRKEQDGSLIPYITAPEIIIMYEYGTGLPLSNADTKIGQKVVLGVMPVSQEWWVTGDENVYKNWKTYFDVCDYDGSLIHYEETTPVCAL